MRRERKLTCFGRFGSELSMLRTNERLGALSPRQIRELRSLERLAVDARGTIKILRKRHEADKAAGAGIASLLDAASQVAASSVGATAFNPGTDPAHLEFVITVSLASENPEGPVQVYTSAAQLIADLQPPTVSNPFGSASVQWLGTLAIPCGDRSYDNYRLVATLVLSGFFGDETIPITTFSFEASVDFATGAIVNVVITGSQLPPLPLAV